MKTIKKLHTALFVLIINISISAQGNTFIKVDDFELLKKGKRVVESELFDDFFKEKDKEKESKWTPQGGHMGYINEKCSPILFEREFEFLSSAFDKEQKIRKFFKKCGTELSAGKTQGVFAILKLIKANYNILSRKQIKPFRLTLSNGSVGVGILAVKDDKPRPWVIVRCGLTCRGRDSGSIRAFIMHLFDEGPFNLMLFGSHTGGNVTSLNGRVSFGGFSEGQEIMAIGNWLKTRSSFKPLVSSLHALGNSHGGHSALYASLFNSYNPITKSNGKTENVYNSIVSYCPVVQLEETFADIFKKGIRGRSILKSVWKELEYAYPQIPYVHDLFDQDKKPKINKIKGLVAQAVTRYLAKVDPESFLQPFQGFAVDNVEKFWQVNNFLSLYKRVQTPLFVFASENDYLVDSKFSVTPLMEQNDKNKNENIGVVRVKYGSHCAASVSYGWQTISSIMRAFFLDHSELYKNKRTLNTSKMDFSKVNLSWDEVHMKQEWKVHAGSKKIELRFLTWAPRPFLCKQKGPLRSGDNCYHRQKITYMRDEFPIKLPVPENLADAEAQTRWLNSNVTVQGDNGLLMNNRKTANKIVWTSY